MSTLQILIDMLLHMKSDPYGEFYPEKTLINLCHDCWQYFFHAIISAIPSRHNKNICTSKGCLDSRL